MLIILGGLVLSWGLINLAGFDDEVIALYYRAKSRLLDRSVFSEGFIPYMIPVEELNDTQTELEDKLAPTLVASVSNEEGTEAPSPQGVKSSRSPDEENPLPPAEPERIVIPIINLEANVVPAPLETVWENGYEFKQWQAPDEFAAGWHEDSAALAEIGNTVLNGHNNAFGEVFRDLEELEKGDLILVYGGTNLYRYEVTNKMILPEKTVRLEKRMENARWILDSDDERLTLVTCWPYESNTHRLIIVARPLHTSQDI